MAELIEAELSSYADLAQTIEDMPVIVRSARRMRRLSLRATAAETGLSFMTIQRVESGHDFDSGTLVALLRWLDGPHPAETPNVLVPLPGAVACGEEDLFVETDPEVGS